MKSVDFTFFAREQCFSPVPTMVVPVLVASGRMEALEEEERVALREARDMSKPEGGLREF